MLKVTLDTNVFPADDLLELKKTSPVDYKVVTVTGRELEGTKIEVNLKPIFETGVGDESRWDECVWGDEASKPDIIAETFVLNESKLGEGKLGSRKNDSRLEFILSVISNGSFPQQGQRGNLTRGQRRQLRDAMIFEAHVREGRDVFVTEDSRGFMGVDGRIKSRLEEEFNTKIMTKKEFLNALAKNRGASSNLF